MLMQAAIGDQQTSPFVARLRELRHCLGADADERLMFCCSNHPSALQAPGIPMRKLDQAGRLGFAHPAALW